MSGWLILGIVAIVFTAVCVLRFFEVLGVADQERKAVDRWWAERLRYRERAEEAIRFGDSSSLADDTDASGGAKP